MDILQESKDVSKKTFFNHVFSTTEENTAEILNSIQYTVLGIIPIVVLNKLIQRFIPDADPEKTSLELLIEILIQIIGMIGGVILVHRTITYVPTYSGFKYENFILTNAILLFLVIILSIQTKVGIKINILYDRLIELWDGGESNAKQQIKKRVRYNDNSLITQHVPSQADYVDPSTHGGFPPQPIVQSKGYDHMMGGGNQMMDSEFGNIISPANSLLGSSFGAF